MTVSDKSEPESMLRARKPILSSVLGQSSAFPGTIAETEPEAEQLRFKPELL